MAFDLTIEFAGLCLYIPLNVQSGAFKELGVAMPDARPHDPARKDPWQNDPAKESHVGYLIYNLADMRDAYGKPVGIGPTRAAAGEPVQCVYRFSREAIEIAGVAPDVMTAKLDLPDFSEFATLLKPIDDLFTGAPKELLMRMRLPGGEFKSLGTSDHAWDVNKILSGKPFEAVTKKFASYGQWTTRIQSDTVTLNLTPLEGDTATTIVLAPADGKAVSLKISNLCCVNPLEWPELPGHVQEIREDHDFRWLYHLMTPKNGTWDTIAGLPRIPDPTRLMVPVPMVHPDLVPPYENCFGAVVSDGVSV
jgi:hypothetical protein